MTREQLVPDRETCERLRAAGFPQDTHLCWIETRGGHIVVHRFAGGQYAGSPPKLQIAAAPTAAEIMEDLRPKDLEERFGMHAGIVMMGTSFVCERWRDRDKRVQTANANLAQALAELWLKVRGSDADRAG